MEKIKSTKHYIFFEKNGTMKTVKHPEYGSVTIYFKDGNPYKVDTLETKIL